MLSPSVTPYRDHHLHSIVCQQGVLSRLAVNLQHPSSHPQDHAEGDGRSKGNPRELVVNLDPRECTLDARNYLVLWRDERAFQGSRLHTLEFSRTPSTFTHFSWTLDGPIPRLERLKVHVLHELDGLNSTISLENPVALQIPTDTQLRALDLYDATLPWTPNYFTRLSELYLRFEYCYGTVVMLEDELLGILGASPRLERLSLVQKNRRPPPERIVQLPRLNFLLLADSPEVVGYILAHTSAILQIR